METNKNKTRVYQIILFLQILYSVRIVIATIHRSKKMKKSSQYIEMQTRSLKKISFRIVYNFNKALRTEV